MKKFIDKTLLFSLLLLLLVAIGIVLPATPRASKSLLFAKIKKDSLLKHTNNPRIIFIGGSNLSFGLNSKLIKDSLKLNPINTSIHFAIGLEYMLDNTIQYIKKKDILILVPEYEQFCGRFVHGGEELLRTIADIEPSKILDLKKEQLKNISKYIVKYSLSKFKINEYFGFKESDIYSVNSFNQYGDVYTHWTMQQQFIRPHDTIIEDYNPQTIDLIAAFRSEVEKKGAKLFISFPSFKASAYDKNISLIKKIEKEFINNNFDILGEPERYRMPDSLMFNSSYHLLKKGVDYRTKLLIQDLKKVQTSKIIYKQ
jgi:hypothetical protein